MSAIVSAPPVLEQGDAAALPLPDSPRSTSPTEGGFEPPKSLPREPETTSGRLSPATETASIEDSRNKLDSTDDAPGNTTVKSTPDESTHARCESPGCGLAEAANGVTEVPSRDDDCSVSIKSETTDNKSVVKDSNTIPAVEDVDGISVKAEAMSPVSETKENDDAGMDKSVKSEGSDDLRGVDHFDKKNNGDVITHYFTRGTRHHALSPIQEDRTFQLAVGSDLWVKVKSNDGPDYVFEVDSAALAAHSPVFSMMAYDTHTRGNQEEWIWVLEDDSIQGLSVMFSLLHLDTRGRMFNEEPDASAVYDVMHVFAKYQIPKAAFYTWTKKWIAGFRKGLVDTTLSKVECLYAAYKLGDFKSLKSCIRHVAHELEIDADGSVRLANGKTVNEALPMTGDVVENLLAIRTADLQALLPPFQEAHDFFMVAGNAEGNRFCKSIDAHGPCNQKLLGSLLQNLIQQQLYPVPTVDSYKSSVGSLAEKISKMDVHGLILPGLEPHKQRHGNCKLGQDGVAKKIMKNEAHIPLSKNLVEHMYRAAKDLGVHRVEQSEFHDYKDMFNKWKDCDVSWLSEEDTGVFDVCDDASSARKVSQ